MDFYGINVKDDITGEGTPNVGTVGNPFGTFYGETTSAKYADLAEKYRVKGDHSKGSVMCVSSDVEADVEMCQKDLDPTYVGVMSMQPGFKMGEGYWKGEYVGLVGRLPVRIIGPVSRQDFIVPTENGCARAGKLYEIGYKIGVALETKTEDEEKLVECIIR